MYLMRSENYFQVATCETTYPAFGHYEIGWLRGQLRCDGRCAQHAVEIGGRLFIGVEAAAMACCKLVIRSAELMSLRVSMLYVVLSLSDQ